MILEISEKGLVFLLTFVTILSIIVGAIIDIYTRLLGLGNILFFIAGMTTVILAEVINSDEDDEGDGYDVG